MLKLNKLYLLVAWGITCFLFYGVAAHADELDQETKLTFNQPVQIPGHTLPAGTYLFKVDNDDENFVRVFNADGTRLYATLATIPALRADITGDTVVTLAREQSGENVMEKWFYPGRMTGHEFIYPQPEQQQLAQAHQMNIVAGPSGSESGD